MKPYLRWLGPAGDGRAQAETREDKRITFRVDINLEGEKFLTGRGRFVDDIAIPEPGGYVSFGSTAVILLSDRWHLDEMVVRIAVNRMYLWRTGRRAPSSAQPTRISLPGHAVILTRAPRVPADAS